LLDDDVQAVAMPPALDDRHVRPAARVMSIVDQRGVARLILRGMSLN
jgi:hypothetical protein